MRDIVTDISWFVETNYEEPSILLSKDTFEECSYARWIAFEIINRILDKPHLPVEDIIYTFVVDMTFMSFTTLNRMQGRLCEIFIRVSNDILSFVVGEKHG